MVANFRPEAGEFSCWPDCVGSGLAVLALAWLSRPWPGRIDPGRAVLALACLRWPCPGSKARNPPDNGIQKRKKCQNWSTQWQGHFR